MFTRVDKSSGWLSMGAIVLLLGVPSAQAQAQRAEPPALNPFGSPAERADQLRRGDAVPGYLELSDGKVHPGQISLTRDARLKIFDEQQKKHREIPLKAIMRIECSVQKEWQEEEWRFKENASDEKYFTGRNYPVREYTHKITLQNGQTIDGTLSGIVYVRAEGDEERRRFLLHKREKGEPGTVLKSLVYVRSIRLGARALDEGKRRSAREQTKPKTEGTTKPRTS
jgi:hypothetical protein